MRETVVFRHTPNNVAPGELLRRLREQEQREKSDRPLAINEILRRSKGGFLRRRFKAGD
jgi:hypothetical protein